MTQTPDLKAGMTLVVASHNPGKVYEIKQMLAPYGLSVVSAGDLDLPEPEETEPTFAGNARLKALAAARASGHPALADDSGLEVDALGGAPGIFSARWAGPDKDFSVAMEKVASEVKDRHGWSAPGPRANFICVLCLAWPDGRSEVFEGKVFGHLVWPVRGGNGFGYDPMFQPDGESETFGEMDPERKHAMSHRARAFAAFQTEKLASLPLAAVEGDRDAVAEEGLAAAAANLSNRAELVSFVANMIADLEARPEAWRAQSLGGFLAGLEETLRTDGEGTGSRLEEAPKWRSMALALLAARNKKNT